MRACRDRTKEPSGAGDADSGSDAEEEEDRSRVEEQDDEESDDTDTEWYRCVQRDGCCNGVGTRPNTKASHAQWKFDWYVTGLRWSDVIHRDDQIQGRTHLASG